MSKQSRVSRPIHILLPTEIEGFDAFLNWPWMCDGRGIMLPMKR